MIKLLPVAAVLEGLTGLALIVAPALVAQLLLGVALDGSGLAVARVAGIALIGLALASLPLPPHTGMLAYSTLVAAYLAWLGLGGMAGPLLWPAVALHVLLSAGLLVRRRQGSH